MAPLSFASPSGGGPRRLRAAGAMYMGGVEMVLKIAVAVFVGGGLGLAVGLLSRGMGGQCPLMCNPYVSTGIGVVLALMIASRGGASGTAPASDHLAVPASEADYRRLVDDPQGVVLVEFYGAHCPACRRQAPAIVALADRFAGRATVAVVDAGSLRAVAQAEGVTAVPTMLVYRNGERVEALVGLTEEAELADLIEGYLSDDDSPAGTTSGEAGP